MENREDILISNKIIPFYLYPFYNITGVLHCRLRKGGLKFNLTSSVISTILLCVKVCSLITYFNVNDVNIIEKNFTSSLILIINMGTTFIGQTAFTVMPIINGVRLKFNNVLTPIIKAEKLLISMGSVGKSDGHTYEIVTLIYYALIIGIGSMAFTVNKKHWFASANVIIFKIYLASVGIIFMALSKQLTSRFMRLNKLIADHGNPEESLDGLGTDLVNVTIQGIREAHFLLCEAIEQINSMFGVQLMVYFTYLFLETVISPYFILQSVIKSTEEDGSPSFTTLYLCMLLLSVIQLVFLTVYSNQTTYYAKETEFYVSSLLSPEMSSKARKEIKYALLQISSNTQEFQVLDLFTIDPTIITSFAGMAVTYLIIILQFQSASTGN